MSRAFGVGIGFVLALLCAGHAFAQPQNRTPPPVIEVPNAPPSEPSQIAPAGSQTPAAQASVPVRITDTPVPVHVIGQPKTEAEYDAEQKERDSRTALVDQLSIYAALLVAVGIFLAAAFAVQTFYLGLTLRAVRRSADLNQRNITAMQRAFVYLGSLEWSEAGQALRVAPVWANSGGTPTRGLRISTNWKTSHGELAGDFAYAYVRSPDHLFLGPNGRAEFGTVHFSMRDVQAAIEERMFLYVWGRATYEDLFEGSQPHFFEFCYRVNVKGTAPNNLAVSFTQYGPRNRCDEEARQPVEGNA